MKISKYAIDRPRAVLVATLLIIALAGLAVFNIPVQRTPAITKAVVLVAVPYPGAQPGEVEEQITRKIEDVLEKLKNVDFIASTSMRGSSVTQVIFLDGVDPDVARGEVKDLVDQIRRELPVGREIQPVVTDIDFENTPLMLVNLTGPENFDERALKRIAEEVQEELESIPGVANTQLFGGREREIHVNINVDLAAGHGLTIADFHRALAAFHAKLPGGSLNTSSIDFHVRNEAKFRGVQDIRQAVVAHHEGRIIRVGDVADVQDTYRRLQNVAHLNSKNGATIIVNKEADINTLGASRRLKEKVRDLEQAYPHLTFSITRDTSDEISLMFRVLGSSFVFGTMLVLVILGWTMGLRVSVLVLVAIPFSSAVGLIFLYLFDIPVSNMVVFSFILVVGMVVDGAIIVAENIHRHVERGEDPVTAAKVGIEEVGMPVIAADMTTVAAFLPMLLVPGIMGDFMSVMPKVVSVSLLGSVLVDHFFIPALAARWYARRSAPQLTKAAPAATGPVELGPMTSAYTAVLRWSLANRWVVVTCSMLAIVWAGMIYWRLGFAFFPGSDRGQFEVKYELPLGSSIHRSIAVSKVITKPLEQLMAAGGPGQSDVLNFVSAIGSSEGLASRLENDPAVGPEFGTIMVQLKSPLDRVRHEDEIIQELRQKIDEGMDQFPGMKYAIHEVEEGPPGGADVAVRLTGDDLSLLGRLGEQIARRLASVPGTVDATSDYRSENPEIVVTPRSAVVGLYDMDHMQIASAVQTAINGDTTIQLSLEDEDITLRLQVAPRYRRHREDLMRLMLTSPTGRRAPIGELAELKRTVGLYAVNRYQHRRAVTARCDVTKSTNPDDVFDVLRDEILPGLGIHPFVGNPMAFLGAPGTDTEGVRATFTGENEERDEGFHHLLRSMTIAIVMIFGILVLQFNSFRQSIVVLMAVPLSFIGVVAGMWLCQFPFSLASFIGLVSLTGIVVNDAIVVVDFINQSRRRGRSVSEAIVEAGVSRLRPVLLTTVTTIGGLLPLFLNLSGGAEFWQPLTGAVIFGLSVATVLTLVVVPVGYSLVYNGADRGRDTSQTEGLPGDVTVVSK